jgi:hypothetical protein
MPEMNITQLNQKAMLVKLTQRKPRLTKRATSSDEQHIQLELGDKGALLYSTIFCDRHSPVRQLINSASTPYVYHKKHTLPYIDRGPRMLPVCLYEPYRDNVRGLIAETDSALVRVMPDYDMHVANDIAYRNEAAHAAGKPPRASVADYPTAAQFEQSIGSEFFFSPLPDQSHFLFDISPEDRDGLNQQLEAAADAARADMYARIKEPVKHLLAKLKIPAGEPGSVFRDTAVENVIEAIALVRSLAMGDEQILQMCDEVASSMSGYARNPQILRDSPIVREQTVAKLAAVADRMGFMFAN